MARMLAALPAQTHGNPYFLLDTLEDQQMLAHPSGPICTV
ncbi:hypothetical protein [Cypionkella sp.]